MAEEGPLTEVWVTLHGRRQRVYRGRNPEHVAWKLKEYRSHQPEELKIGETRDGQEIQLPSPDGAG